MCRKANARCMRRKKSGRNVFMFDNFSEKFICSMNLLQIQRKKGDTLTSSVCGAINSWVSLVPFPSFTYGVHRALCIRNYKNRELKLHHSPFAVARDALRYIRDTYAHTHRHIRTRSYMKR